MIKCGGCWLPDGETHLVEWMLQRNERDGRGRLTYQHHKLMRALELTPGRALAIDVGAHCGLWSMQLGELFDTVHAFEPIPDHVACFARNCAGISGIHIHSYALGECAGRVTMRTDPSSSGDSYPEPFQDSRGRGSTVVEAYDDLEITSTPIDLVKLDCEGYELFALMGMRAALERDHPTIVVEQKPGKAEKYGLPRTEAVSFLQGLGAHVVDEIAGDYFLTWLE